jgi:hypothetical protein
VREVIVPANNVVRELNAFLVAVQDSATADLAIGVAFWYSEKHATIS